MIYIAVATPILLAGFWCYWNVIKFFYPQLDSMFDLIPMVSCFYWITETILADSKKALPTCFQLFSGSVFTLREFEKWSSVSLFVSLSRLNIILLFGLLHLFVNNFKLIVLFVMVLRVQMWALYGTYGKL